LRICPKCQYHDPPYWRPRIFDNPSSIEITLLENLVKEDLGPANWLRDNPGKTYDSGGHYVYRMTRTGMVWRKERELWAVEGWSIPVDGSGTPKSAKFKKEMRHDKMP